MDRAPSPPPPPPPPKEVHKKGPVEGKDGEQLDGVVYITNPHCGRGSVGIVPLTLYHNTLKSATNSGK